MKEDKLAFVTYTVLLCVVLTGHIIIHEITHQQIYCYYGVESEINLIPPYVYPLNASDANEKCVPECELAHSTNEIVGYSLGIIIVFIWISMLYIKGMFS